jgi:hypothetical protein
VSCGAPATQSVGVAGVPNVGFAAADTYFAEASVPFRKTLRLRVTAILPSASTPVVFEGGVVE